MDDDEIILKTLRSMFDKLPVVFVGLDENGVIRFWNKGAEIITGYSREEVENNPDIFKQFFPDPEVLKEVYKIIKSGKSFAGKTFPSQNKDGTPKFFTYYNTGRTSETSIIKNWVIGIDITYRKKVEQDLKTKIHDLEEMTRVLNEKDAQIKKLLADIKLKSDSEE